MDGDGLKPVGTGIKIEAKSKFKAPFKKLIPGQHLWVITGAWTVTLGKEQYLLDTENLMTLDGPGCFWCGCYSTEKDARLPCPGDICK